MYIKHHKKGYTTESGYITLMSVLIVGAIGMSITTSLLLLGLGSSRSSFAFQQFVQANALANTCVESALQQVRDSTPFTGTASLSLTFGSCEYTVSSQGGQDREIISTGTVGSVVRKVKVVIDAINPQISVVSWQEVEEF